VEERVLRFRFRKGGRKQEKRGGENAALPLLLPALIGKRKGTLMKRKAFAMRLHPGGEAEYKRRHDEIWPELKAELRKAGVSNYSIYHDKKTGALFAFQYLADDASDEELAKTEIVKKWWHSMKDIMDTHPDESPVSDALEELFHMD
jgi:L-rhamnose mutarotase